MEDLVYLRVLRGLNKGEARRDLGKFGEGGYGINGIKFDSFDILGRGRISCR